MPIDPTAMLNVASGSALNVRSEAKSSLDKDGFLKLLTEQLKNQDPQSQQDPNEYFNTISQMTMAIRDAPGEADLSFLVVEKEEEKK